MNRKASRPVMAAIVGLGLLSTPAAAADIVVGVPAWPSAEVTANIIGQLLEKDFGVDVAYEQRGTGEILEAIDGGEIKVHPEIWLPNLAEAVDKFKQAGTLALASLAVPASQNICVTSETARQTGIDEVSDLKDPKIAKNFDTDGDGKGEMWIGAPTWSSTAIEKVRAKSYGYDQTMTLLEAPESVAMAAVDVAVSLERPIVFYCYSPHHIFDLHGVQVLGEPAHNPKTWKIVAQDDAEWLDKSSAASGWDVSFFQVGYAASLTTDRPEVAKFLSKIVVTPEDAAAMSYAVQVDRKAPADVAADWIAHNEHRTETWLK